MTVSRFMFVLLARSQPSGMRLSSKHVEDEVDVLLPRRAVVFRCVPTGWPTASAPPSPHCPTSRCGRRLGPRGRPLTQPAGTGRSPGSPTGLWGRTERSLLFGARRPGTVPSAPTSTTQGIFWRNPLCAAAVTDRAARLQGRTIGHQAITWRKSEVLFWRSLYCRSSGHDSLGH